MLQLLKLILELVCRHALTVGGGSLVTAGYLSQSDLTQGLGYVFGLIGIVFSVINAWENHRAQEATSRVLMSAETIKPLAKIAPLLLLTAFGFSLLLCTGCMTSAGVGKYNRIATDKVLQFKAEKGGALLGVDLLAINSGLFAAFDAAPGEMTARVLGDTALAAAAAWGTYKVGDQNGWWGNSDSSSSSSSSSSSNADDHRVNLVNGHTINVTSSGSGNTTINIADDHSTAPAAETPAP